MKLSPLPTTAIAAMAVGAILGASAIVGAPTSVTREAEDRTVAVAQRTLVCPYLGGEADAVSKLTLLAIAGADGSGADTEADTQPELLPAEVTPMETPADVLADGVGADDEPAEDPTPTPAEPVLTLEDRGMIATATVEAAEPTSYAVRVAGGLAPGFAAEQVMNVSAVDLHGLASTSCTSTGREHWFTGLSGRVGERGRLVLSNPSEAPAVVDIEVWDNAGAVQAPGTQDIGVPAGGQVLLLVDALAPEAEGVALRVSAEQGQVAAGIETRLSEGVEPAGLSYVPAAVAPTTEVLVPGVPGNGSRELQIVAPGDTDAIVEVRLRGPDGAFSPAGQDVVTVPANSVLSVPLTEAAGSDPVSVQLSSDEDITAAVRVLARAEEGATDLGITAATAPLTGPAASLTGYTSTGFTSGLLLSPVGDLPAAATVQTLAADGTVAEETEVDIPAGTTVSVPLAAVEGSASTGVVVTPRAPGTVVATRVTQRSTADGALIDLHPLVAPPTEVAVPEVVGQLPGNLQPPGNRNDELDLR